MNPRLLLTLVLVLGCGDTEEPTYLSAEDMLNPETCKDCHTVHYEEWAGSMHAYAAEDPIFLAMNARGQRETNGELGDFCIQCHAPIAMRLGLTTDGLNLAEVPKHLKGVTCYFCHTAEAVEGAHNAPIKLADNLIMKGAFVDPVPNTAHKSGYSRLLDRRTMESATLCGSCHDIVSPKGVHLERTFHEWKESIFAHNTPREKQTCGQCHMRGTNAPIADFDGVVERRRKSHTMVGIDLAITDFPDMERQEKETRELLDISLLQRVCVYKDQATEEVVIATCMENIAAGHSFPSGATQDRRVWVEVAAYDENDKEVFSSWRIADDEPLANHFSDPHLQWFGSYCYDTDGKPSHMIWDAAFCEHNLLPAPTALTPLDPEFIDTHICKERRLKIDIPARVEATVHVRPIALDVIDDLIESGDLDPSYRAKFKTMTLAEHAHVVWTSDLGKVCLPQQ